MYIPFSPFLVTTDHASKRVTREFRSAIEMRVEGKKRTKEKKGRKKGEETRRNNFAASSFGDGTPFWYRIFEKHAVKRRGERRGQLNNWLIKAAARFTDLLEMRFREKRHLARKRREQITRTRTAGENRISSSQLVRGAINRSVGPDSSYPQAQCG